jgi:hypothetical protein
MALVSKKQFHVYLIELAVIVFGILIAFEVEEWRDAREEGEEIEASLQRLREETEQNLEVCGRRQTQHRMVAIGVEQVFLSLRSGNLEDKDISRFETGLSRAAELPNYVLRTTVADEMISTGLLKELSDNELRQAIAALRSMQMYVSASYSNRRASVRELSRTLYDFIEIEFTDPASVFGAEREFAGSLEAQSSVLYDFDEMATNRRLMNLFFEALDSHADLLGDIERLCGLVTDIDDGLRSTVSN